MRFFCVKYFLLLTGLLLLQSTSAQHVRYNNTPVAFIKEKQHSFDAEKLRNQMMNDGLPSAVADKLVELHRKLWSKGLLMQWQHPSSARDGTGVPTTCALCSGLSADNGWGAWQGAIGDNSNGNPALWGPLSAPASPNFNLNSGTGIDPCTPGNNPGDPPLPLVAPGFGNTSIELGEQQTAGSITEQLVYPLTVTVADTNFIYAYALVLEDAGHPDGERPFAEFVMLDPAGDTIPCAFFHYEAAEPNGQSLPGFYQGTCGAKYKPWTTVGVNLSAYVGQTVTLVITNADCIWGAHFAQSYWDFNCGTLQGNSTTDCFGGNDTLSAPDDPSINYGYHWTPGGQTTRSIVVQPQPGDTFIVEVLPPTGCPFYEIFVPQVAGINPAFNYSGSCGTINFHDATTTGSGLPIVSWHWNFPGGNPSSSTQQNPVVHYPAGNFSATLIVATASGCIDSITINGIITGEIPTADFSNANVCLGSPVQFQNLSSANLSDPIVQYHWNFGDGGSSSGLNPSHVFANDSTYQVSLLVTTASGCVDSVYGPIIIYSLPHAQFSSSSICENDVASFVNQSSGNGLHFDWNFGDDSISALQNPHHIFSGAGNFMISLIATSANGCTDAFTATLHVNPKPVAGFFVNKVCVGSQSCFNDISTVAQGSIQSWSWNFGDIASGAANESDEKNPCHTYTLSGNFTPVQLTVVTDSGCLQTTERDVAFWQLPHADFSSPPVCLQSRTQFTDESNEFEVEDPVQSWSWDFGDNQESPMQNPFHVYQTPGIFPVKLVVTTAHQCRDTIEKAARVYGLPSVAFSDSAEGCAPFCASFSNLSNSIDGSISNLLWFFSGGVPSETSAQNPEVCYNFPGSYNVTLIATTDYGCKDTLKKPWYINVYDLPAAEFSIVPDTTTSLLTPAFQFQNNWSSNVASWQWDFGDGSPITSDIANPNHSYGPFIDNNTYYSYLVTLYVQTDKGCRDSIMHRVEVTPDFSFFIPNTFSPNGDYDNDFFYGKGRGISDYTISIYDRWGILLWTCHENGLNTDWDKYSQEGMPSACRWDGLLDQKTSDKKVQNDVYIWRVNLTTIFGEEKTFIGHVTAVK
jgi:gliding motility-associated-like protein